MPKTTFGVGDWAETNIAWMNAVETNCYRFGRVTGVGANVQFKNEVTGKIETMHKSWLQRRSPFVYDTPKSDKDFPFKYFDEKKDEWISKTISRKSAEAMNMVGKSDGKTPWPGNLMTHDNMVVARCIGDKKTGYVQFHGEHMTLIEEIEVTYRWADQYARAYEDHYFNSDE